MSNNGKKIGLLGGSFNPAHEGHLYISKECLKRLNLDEIWWLVSPNNPLKTKTNNFDERFNSSIKINTEPFIKIKDYEKEKGLIYTIDTINSLKKDYPEHTFVWLMGSDNLSNFHLWKDYKKIISTVPIVIIKRTQDINLLESEGFKDYIDNIRTVSCDNDFALSPAPKIIILDIVPKDISSTTIRAKEKNE